MSLNESVGRSSGQPMGRFLRWLLVVPLAVLGVAVGILAALVLQRVTTQFCPSEFVVSGQCTAWWFHYAESVALCTGASLGAALAVVLPSLAAPRLRKKVAAAAFAAGLAYALYFLVSVGVGVLVPFLFAVAAGAVALRLVRARVHDPLGPSARPQRRACQ